jgi:hypothetical protein
MPDRDVFPGLHRSWRRVGRAVCGEQSPDAVSALGEKALAEQLRKDPIGLARLGDAAAAIADVGDAGALRQIVEAGDLQASPVLRSLEAEARASRTADEHELIERTLYRVVRGQLDSLRPQLVASGRSAVEASNYLNECASGIRTTPIAEQIASGRERVRAPRRLRSRTADLLHESLT